jgi:hypothetical protein
VNRKEREVLSIGSDFARPVIEDGIDLESGTILDMIMVQKSQVRSWWVRRKD